MNIKEIRNLEFLLAKNKGAIGGLATQMNKYIDLAIKCHEKSKALRIENEEIKKKIEELKGGKNANRDI